MLIGDCNQTDYENGVIRNLKLNSRVFINSSACWTAMKSRLFQVFGTGAASILYGIGRSYGTEIVGLTEGKLDQPLELIEFLKDYGLASGWGKITSRLIDGRMEVLIENCCFCDGVKDSKDRVCYEVAGVISGLMSRVTMQEVAAKESKCAAKGDGRCEFVAGVPKSL